MFECFRSKRTRSRREKLLEVVEHEQFMIISLESHLSELNRKIATDRRTTPALEELRVSLLNVIEYFEEMRDGTLLTLRREKRGGAEKE